jgi:hypothetical protein
MSKVASMKPKLAALLTELRRPMFGHERVSMSRHAVAVLGSAVFASFALAAYFIVAVAVEVVLLGHGGRGAGLGQMLVTVAIVGAFGGFVLILTWGGFVFTAAHLLLRMFRCNFGLAYPAVGLLGGTLICQWARKAPASAGMGEMAFYAATGAATGLIYWLLAVRGINPRSQKDLSQLELALR